jgi:hypothetical protein
MRFIPQAKQTGIFKKINNKNMKQKIILIAIVAFYTNAYSQPVIQDGSNVPTPGYSAPVFSIVSSSTEITNGGANHTWDFSSFTFNPIGTLSIITPSSAPMGSSFPSSNYAMSLNGNSFSFFNIGSSKMEVQAWTIAAAGSGNDYSPNPRTIFNFPFSFNDTAFDTWQKVGGSQNTVTLYYDSYGTLITPSGTYTNVVRIRENYGIGADDYFWYSLNPLIPIAIFDHNTTTLYHIAATQVTGINEQSNMSISANIYPNPANEIVNISNIPIGSTLNITDITGKTVFNSTIITDQTTISTRDFVNGIYFIRVENNGIVSNKKLVVNKQ